jgi:hypothetical protein
VAMEHDLYKNIDVNVCTEFEMLKVKVIIFFFWYGGLFVV